MNLDFFSLNLHKLSQSKIITISSIPQVSLVVES